MIGGDYLIRGLLSGAIAGVIAGSLFALTIILYGVYLDGTDYLVGAPIALLSGAFTGGSVGAVLGILLVAVFLLICPKCLKHRLTISSVAIVFGGLGGFLGASLIYTVEPNELLQVPLPALLIIMSGAFCGCLGGYIGSTYYTRHI